MKKRILFTAAALAVITLVACGSSPQEGGTQQSAQSETATATATQESTPTDKAWSTEGAFIDDKDNHLVLVYYGEDAGVGQVGWTVSAILGEEMYGGFMDEVNGTLKGDIISYDAEGNEKEKIAVTITDADPYIVMVTENADVYQFIADEMDYTEGMGETMPLFQYQSIHAYSGYDYLWAAAYNFLTFDASDPVNPDHALIPYVNIVDVDDSDSENVLVYGDFYLFDFEKKDDTLALVSSSHIPGCIHMRQLGEGDFADYEGLSMDKGLIDDEVKEIFGEYYEHYLKLSSDQQMRESGTATNIADYVKANDLPITKYQLEDGQAKELPKSLIKVYRESANLPLYAYPDTSAREYAVYQYLLQLYAERADISMIDVIIPYACIFAEDDSNDQDIVEMFTGWISQYNLEGDELQMQAGSEITGAVHLKKTADGYEAVSFEEVLDGSEYEKTAKKIFGSHYSDFKDISREDLNKVQKQIISDYVNTNKLEINSFKDMGSDPVLLD